MSTRQHLQDRFGQVQTDINRTVGNIEKTVSRLTGIASQVSQVAAELSSGNENLSSRAEQQPASIEETMTLSGKMQENANDLAQAISFFRTRNGGQPLPPPARPVCQILSDTG